jgi:hypothetical protein
MLQFQRPPDVLFQAILRDSMSYSIDLIKDLIENNQYDEARAREEMKGFCPAVAKVFPPSLARTTLLNLRGCLDRPELYYLNNYHYLLLYDVMDFYADIHNDIVAESKSKKERKESSFVDPFYVETIDMDGIVELYFYDIDFLTDAETMLNIPAWFRKTFSPETFGLSQGMLPHAEELELKMASSEDIGVYKVTHSEYFGPGSKVYPDFAYYDDKHPEE